MKRQEFLPLNQFQEQYNMSCDNIIDTGEGYIQGDTTNSAKKLQKQ